MKYFVFLRFIAAFAYVLALATLLHGDIELTMANGVIFVCSGILIGRLSTLLRQLLRDCLSRRLLILRTQLQARACSSANSVQRVKRSV